jgi:D-3-phosphoglycerate dehydrogenase
LDNVDMAAAAERGLEVVNVPDFCVNEVADHTLALVLAITRRVAPLDLAWRVDPAGFAGRWDDRFRALAGVERASRQQFGLIGLGRIGQAVGHRLASFGYELVAHDPFVGESGYIPLLSLEELLRTSDLVSLHVPLTDDTLHILDAQAFALMKPGAVVINTSRGALIDQAALVAGLRNGRPGWAGLDVFAEEPLPSDSELFDLSNVVLTPHVAFYSTTSVLDLKRRAMEAVIAAVASHA